MSDVPVTEHASTLPAPTRTEFAYLAESAAGGEASPADVARLETDPALWRDVLEEILEDTEAGLVSARALTGPERAQVVADFEAERTRLVSALERFVQHDGGETALLPSEARLQTSWSAGRIVAWGGGPGLTPTPLDELPRMLDEVGAPANGWGAHRSILLPSGAEAPALSLPVQDALGWLLEVGAQVGSGEPGASVRWLGRVAVYAAQLVALGHLVPTLQAHGRREGGRSQYSVRWQPAQIDRDVLMQLASDLPGSVSAITPKAEARDTAHDALAAMVHAFAAQSASKLQTNAEPPTTQNTADVVEAVIAHLDGSRFEAPTRVGSDVAKRLAKWGQPAIGVTGSKLVVELQPPDSSNAWHLTVLGADPDGHLVPVEVAMVDHPKLVDQLVRVERLLPALQRPGGARRGQVILSQDEAWDLMTVTGPLLESVGFDVRVPALSRKRATPSLRLTTEASGETVVGARQLTNVSWSALFDDVELTAADIHELSKQARPLVQSHGQWIELDKADLAEAAAALAERANTTQMTGAEILRQALGLEGATLAGGASIEGSGWAADLLNAARSIPTNVPTQPTGFNGELRSYQAEAVAWLGFLHTAELGGCLALDMGLGKTPTILAHLSSVPGAGPALVIAPPAVVGNWANEAARFSPGLQVVVHHGATRASGPDIGDAIKEADVVITTYGTAVRDIEALSGLAWDRVILDEAQAIKNPASETSQQLRRLNARVRLALTGTPIENGLGDLWSILDFTNPGLVGTRNAFIAQLSATGQPRTQGAEAALRALNGILVFRRTKSEPAVAAELPDRIDQLDHCSMTPEQIGLYQAVLDTLTTQTSDVESSHRQAHILAAITALKQICNHPVNYQDDGQPLDGRSGKLARLEEIVDSVFEGDEKVLIFTHFATWGVRLAAHLSERTGVPIACYHGGLARGARDAMIETFQNTPGKGALVLSLKAGGTGLNLTAANHVVLYDRWWNPAVEDQARDRAWRIGQTKTVVSHRLVCPGTVDERVEDVVADKRRIANLILPKSSSLADLTTDQLRNALGIDTTELLTDDESDHASLQGVSS